MASNGSSMIGGQRLALCCVAAVARETVKGRPDGHTVQCSECGSVFVYHDDRIVWRKTSGSDRKMPEPGLAGLTCSVCGERLDPNEGLHPDNYGLPERQGDGIVRHYPVNGKNDGPCSGDQRAWVVHSKIA